ncbi:MAG TPA: precorrin-2 C(20)-methyltransferase [Devosia sp.]|nr:precorrin-2 C(20)-methyltransferase [Devosia sp.]
MNGTLFLVGVGPGDPELLTLKAARILASVPVVAFPKKPGDFSLALNIARSHLNPDAELLPAGIPMQVNPGAAQSAYDALAGQLDKLLNAGKDVAYLCEGDPLFYGSANHLLSRLNSAHSIEIIPGITSLSASAAAICRPLAARADVLKVLPATLGDDILQRELANADAVVIIKTGRHLPRIRALLEQADLMESALITEHASHEKQRIVPLSEYTPGEAPYFSTILCCRGADRWK